MPIYDRICQACGWVGSDLFEPVEAGRVDCPNGHETERVWISTGRSPNVIDDTIIGGRVYENLGHEPVKVESRSQLKRELQARGLTEFVRHVPTPGSDKSPHTVSWSSMSQHSLDEAKKLLERVTS